MRKIYLILSILLLAATALRAQQNSFTGTWQLDLEETIGLMEPATRQKFDALDPGARSRAEVSMTGRTFLFNSNGTVTVNWKAQGHPRTSSGTWAVSGDTLSITIDGEVQQYTYEVAARRHLILRNATQLGFFTNLYLTWQP
jgi:hypothetical protein